MPFVTGREASGSAEQNPLRNVKGGRNELTRALTSSSAQ